MRTAAIAPGLAHRRRKLPAPGWRKPLTLRSGGRASGDTSCWP